MKKNKIINAFDYLITDYNCSMNFEENQVPEAILDKLTKVCTCRSITRKTIKEAILDGAHTFPQVKEATRAGTGACGGKGCGPRIVKLLAEMKEQGKI